MAVKSVKFNLNNKIERDLHKFAKKQGNFSGFVKDLILKEKEKQRRKIYTSDETGVIRIKL